MNTGFDIPCTHILLISFQSTLTLQILKKIMLKREVLSLTNKETEFRLLTLSMQLLKWLIEVCNDSLDFETQISVT